MDLHKLRVRIGPHEFEAEGTQESVSEQFKLWKELIGAAPTPATGNGGNPKSADPAPVRVNTGPPAEASDLIPLFEIDESAATLSLIVRPTGEQRNADSLLLLIYGFRRLLNLTEVPVTKLTAAARATGINVDRIDRVLQPFVDGAFLLKSGRAKGSKYRLTNTGAAKGDEIAKGLLAQMH